MEFTDIIKNYPLLNAVFIGIGMGGGIYAGINKLFDLFISIKLNTSEIPSIYENTVHLKQSNKKQQDKIDELKKIIENHDFTVKQELRKNRKDEGG